ncbi:MAG TPA: sodium:proton antiporter [Tepidisphaeraceae bacterium]|jgi:multicomponent Na+:H+ antiporter subunit C
MDPLVTHVGYAVAGWLLLVGIYGVVSSRHLVHMCLCLAVLQASTYILLTVIGFRPHLPAPIFTDAITPAQPAVDPVIAALMLTDIVVEATVVALLLAIAVQIHKRTGSVDPNKVNVMRG